MDRLFTLPISIEKFAAYLDGNLPESQIHEMDQLIASDPAMADLSEVSDVISEDTQHYLNDEFAAQVDMEMLDELDFEIPDIDNGIDSIIEHFDRHENIGYKIDSAACEHVDILDEEYSKEEFTYENDIEVTIDDDNIEYDNDTFESEGENLLFQ